MSTSVSLALKREQLILERNRNINTRIRCKETVSVQDLYIRTGWKDWRFSISFFVSLKTQYHCQWYTRDCHPIPSSSSSLCCCISSPISFFVRFPLHSLVFFVTEARNTQRRWNDSQFTVLWVHFPSSLFALQSFLVRIQKKYNWMNGVRK